MRDFAECTIESAHARASRPAFPPSIYVYICSPSLFRFALYVYMSDAREAITDSEDKSAKLGGLPNFAMRQLS